MCVRVDFLLFFFFCSCFSYPEWLSNSEVFVDGMKFKKSFSTLTTFFPFFLKHNFINMCKKTICFFFSNSKLIWFQFFFCFVLTIKREKHRLTDPIQVWSFILKKICIFVLFEFFYKKI